MLLVCNYFTASAQCNCPAVNTCSPCDGDLISLTLQYNGPLALTILATDDSGVIYSALLVSPGQTFTVVGSQGNGKFSGTQLNMFVNALLNFSINTSCSSIIGVNSTLGSFTVLAGQSKDGGALCCTPAGQDMTAPVIAGCPSNISVNLSSGCSKSVSWVAPTANDNCGGVSLTSTHNPGANFPKGITTVTYTATDDFANTTICSFTVTVIDDIDPVIAGCPANIVLSGNASCQAVANWTLPTAADNCAISTFVGSHTSGGTFPVGSTPVTYTATDGAGNTVVCTFSVIVNDNTNPVITNCPTTVVANANASCLTLVSWTPPTAADNCSVTSFTSTHSSGSAFPLGTTPVTYTATDGAGNTTTCSFNVVVNDTSSPVFSACPAPIIVDANGACEAVVTWTTPSVSDNCSIATFTSSHTSGSTFPLGTTLVTYTATDFSANTATCSFNVTVSDMTNPVIVGCPTNIVIAANGSCQATVSWTLPTASDNCTLSSFTSTKTPGSLFPLGTSTVTYTATDAAENTATCSFTVTVTDTSAPVISGCPSNILLNANGSCQAIATWTAPTVLDNCTVSTFTSTKVPGSTFPLGTTLVSYTATDGSGNTSTCSFSVIVSDNTNPVITACPADIILPANGSCQAVATWTVPVASDNCGSATLVSTFAPGATFPLGTTQVKYTATDGAGNSSLCTFNVIVQDNTMPIISGCVSTDIVVTANASCQAVATWSAPAATDNCTGLTFTSTYAPGNVFSIGTTQVKYTAKDAGGNTSICTFNVIVKDVTNPVISGCPSSIALSANASCRAVATWTPPGATDNCGTATITSTHTSGNLFPIGTTQVKYTATDGAGNTSVCTFNVTVSDVTNPVITACPSTISIPSNGSCQGVATWAPPTASDNCGSVTLVSTHAPGSTFPIGTTQVKYTATDAAGKISTCTFNVVVTDNSAPVIAGCPSNITVSASAACQTTVNWTAPTATDNCTAVTLNSTHASGSLFQRGITLVKYTATDVAGNVATCTFNVTVVDDVKPVFSTCVTSDIVVSANTSCQAVATWTPPTAADNCSGMTLVSSHISGALFSLGTTAVTYTATDATGNIATCKFNVIVKNNTNPIFTTCPIADIQATATAGCVAAVSWTPPTATVNCGSVNVSSSHQPGGSFPIGTTVVTYSATSETGGLTTCSFNVIVKDALAPVISGCSNITVIANGSCDAVASWEIPSTTDCSVVTLTSSHQPGDSFPIGETEVTYSATDEYGNRTTCGFVVIVEDKTPPILQYCPATLKALTDISCSANVTWTEPILADNCGATTLTRSHAPGQVFPIGTTIVTYTGTDAAGNTASCQFSVIVTTEELPVISNCPLDLTIESDEEGQATVTWSEPIASTACGPVTLTSSIQPGDRFPIGTTMVEYKATNSNGNTASCTFNVTVLQAPIEIELGKLITPDGNQQNDEWIITNIEKYRDNKVIIVDRWGSVIYSASGYNNANIVWTGSNRAGSLAPTGTYFYTFSVRYGPAWIEKTGFIELIR